MKWIKLVGCLTFTRVENIYIINFYLPVGVLEFVENLIKQSRTGNPDTEEIIELVASGRVSKKARMLVRADGGKKKGLGDLISSMNIAKRLEKKYQFVFVSKNYETGIEFVKSRGYDVLILPLDGGDREDLKTIQEYCERHGVDFCLVQLFPNNPNFVKGLSKFVKTLMVDFEGGIEVPSNILLCWDLDADEKKYKFLKPNTVRLLGPKYVPLKENILRYGKKSYKSKVKKIVVTTGGSDPHDITFALLKALEGLNKSYNFQFILGPSFKRLKEFKDKAAEKFECIVDPENPHKLFGKSDLVISSGGLTSFELAALGVPFIGISKIPHEVRRLKKLDSLGVCKFISAEGNLGSKIKKALNDLSDKKIREEMGKRGKKLVDGKGAERVAEEIEKLLVGLYEDKQ